MHRFTYRLLPPATIFISYRLLHLRRKLLLSMPPLRNFFLTAPIVDRQPTTVLLAEKARTHHIWIHGGSISEVNPTGTRNNRFQWPSFAELLPNDPFR